MKLDKKYQPYYIVAIALVFSLLLSVIFFAVKSTGKRRAFVYPSAESGKYIVEYRYLPKKPVQGDVNLYIDELLLGSGVERTKMLFTLGTKVNSCFLRGDTLYLDLSSELFSIGNDVINIKDGVALLKKNVQNNFPKIKQIELFVDGKYAFESR